MVETAAAEMVETAETADMAEIDYYRFGHLFIIAGCLRD